MKKLLALFLSLAFGLSHAAAPIPNIFATQPSGNVPASYLDVDFALTANYNTFSNYLVDTGVANVYVVTFPAGTTGSLAAGLYVNFKASADNTGASTLAVNGMTAKSITNYDASALAAGQIKAGAVVSVIYDGTQFKLAGQPGGVWYGNITGSALTAGTVTTAAQPNITSVGTVLTVGTGSGGLIQGYLGTAGYGGIWSTNVTPSNANYSFGTNSGTSTLQGSSFANLAVNGTTILSATSTGATIIGLLTGYAGVFDGASVLPGVASYATVSPAINASAEQTYIGGTLNKAASGTHADFASLYVDPITVGGGSATLTNATTVKITGAPSGGGTNRALWVTAGLSDLSSVAIGGNLVVSSAAPTIASGFGTSPTILANNTAAFQVTVGSGGTASQGTLTFPAAPNNWACTANAAGSQGFGFIEQMAPSGTTSVLVSNIHATTGLAVNWPAGQVIQFQCTAF